MSEPVYSFCRKRGAVPTYEMKLSSIRCPGQLALLHRMRAGSAALQCSPCRAGAVVCPQHYLCPHGRCANYIKLPPYSSYEVLRERVLFAVREGQGSFDLS